MKRRFLAAILSFALCFQAIPLYAAGPEVEFSDEADPESTEFTDEIPVEEDTEPPEEENIDVCIDNENDLPAEDSGEESKEAVVIEDDNNDTTEPEMQTQDQDASVELFSDSGEELKYENFTYEIKKREATITGYEGSDTSVTIPAEIEGCAVTEIDYRAFYGCGSLETVQFPDTLKIIRSDAFRECNNLKNLVLPESLTELGSGVFTSPYISQIMIPKNVTDMGYAGLADLSAFSKCENLKIVVFESGMKKIPAYALSQCKSVTTIEIPEGVTEIGESAFWKTGIETIKLPNTLKSTGSSVLENCDFLKKITIPDQMTEIASRAFYGCDLLETVEFPDTLKIIESDAFRECNNLKDLVLPENLMELGSRVFTSPYITQIMIPKNVTSMEYAGLADASTFSDCKNLKSVIFESGMTKIPEYALAYCTSVTAIEIPEGVTEIGESAFWKTGIETLELPNTLKSIGSSIMENCDSLKEITIPDQMTEIASQAFYGCDSLETVKFPNNLNIIRSGAFGECNLLETVKFPDTLKSIESDAFRNCNNLKELVLPENLMELGSRVFTSPYITQITIPKNVTNMIYAGLVDASTFSDCENLKTVTFESGMAKIPAYALAQCKSVTAIEILEGVTEIEEDAFWNAENLSRVIIPESVTTIADTSFSGCNKLTIYGYKGSYAETYANNHGIEFIDIQTASSTLVGGTLESVNLNELTLQIDGKSYNVSEDFDLTRATEILEGDEADKTVIAKSNLGELTEVYKLSEVLYLSAKIQPSLKDLKYEDEKFESNEFAINVEVSCEMLPGTTLQKKDVKALGCANLNITELQLMNLSDKGINFGKKLLGVKREIVDKTDAIIHCGDKKVYSFSVYTDKDYVPEQVKTEIELKVFVKQKNKEDSEYGGSCMFAIQNVDMQRELAQANKNQSNLNSLVKRAKSELATNQAITLDPNLNEYLDTQQRENLRQFLTVWIAQISQANMTQYSKDKKVQRGIYELLGINVKTVPFITTTTGTVQVKATTAYGEKTFEFSIKLTEYGLGSEKPYSGDGKMEYEVLEKNGIPGNISRKGMCLYTYADMETFAEQVKDIAEASVKKIWKLWGDDADKVAEYFVSKPFAELINTQYGSFSDGLYTLVTLPTKKYLKEISVHCPVDVYVYNSLGEVCGQIVNNQVDPAYNEVYMWVDGDAKYIRLSDDDYFIKLVGSDQGEMNYYVREFADGALSRTISYERIPLTKGKTYDAFVPEESEVASALYDLKSKENEVIQATGDTSVDKFHERVFATGVTLNKTAVKMKVGDKTTLTAAVQPNNADNKRVNWESSNASIAAVDDNGQVTAKKRGQAEITVSTVDGAYTAKCTISVEEKEQPKPQPVPKHTHTWGAWKTVKQATVFNAQSQQRRCSGCRNVENRVVGGKLKPTIKLNADSVTLKIKQSTTGLKVSGLARGDSVASWKSSNKKIVKVSSKGKLSAQKKTGRATVTVTLRSGLRKSIKVKVQKSTVRTSKITGLSKKLTLKKGKSYTLKPVRQPFTSQEKLTYTSSNKKIVTVSSKGKLKARKAGKAKITVRSGKKKYTVTVTVPKTATKKITNIKSKLTIKKGKTYTLKPKLSPRNSDYKITYKSSNKKIATVSSKGKIKARKRGTVKITIKSGNKKVTCTVKVK